MRLLIMLVAAAGIGALSMHGALTMFPHMTPTFMAVRAQGGDAAGFRLSDLNFIRAAYDAVKSKITSGNSAAPFSAVSSKPIPMAVKPFELPKPIVLDQKQIDRAVAAGINARINQDYHRNQALVQYGRNPMGWRGAPPH